MIDPAWVGVGVAVVTAASAAVGVHTSNKTARARLDTTLKAIDKRIEKASGAVEITVLDVRDLTGRVKRAEGDIRALRDDVRETRDGVRDLLAKARPKC
jgi:chromosome segregation ATPase